LQQNIATALNFTPLSAEERADLLVRSSAAAQDGRYEPFKTTRDYDANEGRLAHGYPFIAAAD
jgi:hypothetical protein